MRALPKISSPAWAHWLERDRMAVPALERWRNNEIARLFARGLTPNSRLRKWFRRVARLRRALDRDEETLRLKTEAMQPAGDRTARFIDQADAVWLRTAAGIEWQREQDAIEDAHTDFVYDLGPLPPFCARYQMHPIGADGRCMTCHKTSEELRHA